MRILIVSNNCLSEQNSNGRTLLNLIRFIPKENISQIYTSGEIPDENYCNSSLRLTNKAAVESYYKEPDLTIPASKLTKSSQGIAPKGKKTAATMLLRDIVWDKSIRLRKYIIRWAKDKNPDLLLLQVGDASLLITIATEIVKSLNVPLVIYNTEDYYFKNYDYMRKNLTGNFIYNIFHRRFCKSFDRMMSLKVICIYNCIGLKKIYDNHFRTESHVIYCGTNFQRVEKIKTDGLILYSGNLGVGRHKAIMEVGEALQEIDKSLYIDVFGQATEEVAYELKNSVGVRYHGLVSYEDNCKNIKNSRLLVHVESFDAFYKVDTMHAFSTKIADYCASGVPILVYAPEQSESVVYAQTNRLAIVVNQKEQLQKMLKISLYDTDTREAVANLAQLTVSKNHNEKNNSIKFGNIMSKVCTLECIV